MEHLCRLITPLTSTPTIQQASMLQRSMYKPLFTSSSSRLFTFIYLSLFFICWFSRLSGSEWESVFLRGWFVHIYQPEMKYALWGIPAHLYLSVCAVMALSKAQSCPCSSSAWLPPVLHLSFQIDSIFHTKHAAERRLPRHISRCFSIPQQHVPQFPFSPGCVIDAGQHAVWPRCPQINASPLPSGVGVSDRCATCRALSGRADLFCCLAQVANQRQRGPRLLTSSHNTLDASFSPAY